MSFASISILPAITPASLPSSTSNMATPKNDCNLKHQCTCPLKVEGPNAGTEDNCVAAITISTRTSLIGTWPNSCSSDPSLRCSLSPRTHINFWGITWSRPLLQIPQTRVVFQRRTGIAARLTDRASYRGDRYPGTSGCKAARLCRNQLTSTRVRERIPLCVPITRKGFLSCLGRCVLNISDHHPRMR